MLACTFGLLAAANIPPPQLGFRQEVQQQQQHYTPPQEPNVLSRLSFSHLNPTLRLGAARPLEEADLPPLPWGSSSATASFDRKWEALRAVGAAEKDNAAGLALFRAFGREFALAGFVKLLADKGANVNVASVGGNTALMKAAQNGHDSVLNTLIEAGADLRQKNDDG